MDDPSQPLHPPKNKGKEAMAYLTFLIDHFHALPDIILFLHSHQKGWPGAWHVDAPDHDNVASVRSLQLAYVQEHGYANMRCSRSPGCPAEMQPFRNDSSLTPELALADAWMYMFREDDIAWVPRVVGVACCAQFAVSRRQVLMRKRNEYVRYREWLLETDLDDESSGRVLEYMWHVFFGKPPVWCPDEEECRCQQFGRCGEQSDE